MTFERLGGCPKCALVENSLVLRPQMAKQFRLQPGVFTFRQLSRYHTPLASFFRLLLRREHTHSYRGSLGILV